MTEQEALEAALHEVHPEARLINALLAKVEHQEQSLGVVAVALGKLHELAWDMQTELHCWDQGDKFHCAECSETFVYRTEVLSGYERQLRGILGGQLTAPQAPSPADLPSGGSVL
ncbi:hypothetical protein CJ179_38870 [Rhodococcus sp. ACS1]|uniref:hypothetical protein n=1 Tax=Rhodococcus sp. ACS1 TaxID=2028570 RepID=UPI000BB136C2|nr:hypothetical protein [Rhodococcus sp. ACS1]PBC38561.1 hypothetical protein CJ179_38870 [Rhodococcus sp. ACS1]